MDDKLTRGKALIKLKVAELRVLSSWQRGNARAYLRQAAHPAYPGQDEICATKAAQSEALADRTEAQAALLEADI